MVAELVGLIGGKKGAKFANFLYRVKKTGELSRYHLILGASTETLYQKDVVKLEAMLPTLKGIEFEAASAILNSRKESLTVGIGNNSKYTCADVYVDVDGVPGVKIHKETGYLYVTGLCESKTVVEEGEPQPPVKSKPLTIAKRKIEKELPSARFRQFILKRVTKATMNGETLELVESEDKDTV